MYLEISGRRTGKTTRLIDAARLAAEQHNSVVIVTFNSAQAFHLREKYRLPDNIIITATAGLNVIDEKRDLISWDLVPYFWEEFEFIDNVRLNVNDYYCTTPRNLRSIKDVKKWKNGKREDLLLDLISLNKGIYVKHNNFGILTDKNSYGLMVEEFNAELKGHFI